MSQTTYLASKSRSQGREGYCVQFNHPVAKTRQGKPVKVRRGLKTQDESEADRLVAEMNKLLADPRMWTASARATAVARGCPEVIAKAFFDPLEPKVNDGWAAREALLPLPSPADGYSRVQLLGATGAGKTTLLRQFIGADPTKERFPSTSTAKTTVADMEIILAPEEFRAVVTFLSRDIARLYVEECVVRALAQAIEGQPDDRILRELLEHREQRFRLSYVLGKRSRPDDQDDDDEEEVDGQEGGEIEVTPSEHDAHLAYLERTLAALKSLAVALREKMERALGEPISKMATTDRDAFVDLVQEQALGNDEVAEFVEGVMEEVAQRFEHAQGGDLERTTDGWPFRWTTTAPAVARAEFIKRINRFTSNYAPNFGKLLTPLVEGIRVRGPFQPSWATGEEIPKLVLMDGEGLGHTSHSASSLPTSLTEAFTRADVILLADNATQPMLTAPQVALRTISAMGHDRKLAIAFTHFDQVRGDNLDSLEARREHVYRSLENALSSMEEGGMRETIRGLRRNLGGRVFYLSKMQESLESLSAKAQRRSEADLGELLRLCRKAIELPEGTAAVPVYDMANFVISVAKAMAAFQRAWDGRLGLKARPGIPVEHWTRVKALARRFAEFGLDSYDTMRPVADLLRDLAEGLSDFIATPRRWKPLGIGEEARQRAVETVRQKMAERVKEFASANLQLDPRPEWNRAWSLSGRGSGSQRSREIWAIYEKAAPDIGEVPSDDSATVLDTLRRLFREAVEEAGGEIMD